MEYVSYFGGIKTIKYGRGGLVSLEWGGSEYAKVGEPIDRCRRKTGQFRGAIRGGNRGLLKFIECKKGKRDALPKGGGGRLPMF